MGWYSWRRELVEEATPNPGHEALVELEDLFAGRFVLLTQNVDGLHRRVGSRNVVELHGSILRSKCSLEDDPAESRRGAVLCHPPARAAAHICGQM
jgi:NAD-dependent deacetylase